jgi:hypothetical protein
MKKILVLSAILALFIASASAQGPGDRIRHHRIEQGFNNGQLTRPEKFRLQKNQFRYKVEKRRAFRDGRVSPMEKRRLSKMKRHNHREMFRYRHNGRRRVI